MAREESKIEAADGKLELGIMIPWAVGGNLGTSRLGIRRALAEIRSIRP
jgi:hypothetical protein